MKEFRKDLTHLCFDDILMVPQYSEINSRRDIKLEMDLSSDCILSLPVIASPMDTVCESEMAITMAKNGGLGIIHRFMPFEKQLLEVSKASQGGLAVGAAIGAKGEIEYEATRLASAGASLILVDTANGHSKYAVDAVKRIKDTLLDLVHVMAGNVSTPEGYVRLVEAGANSVRVGIGGGSVCTTRIMSGHGVPTLASVMEIKKAKWSLGLDAGIIADGGIKNTGDMVKAFAAGADAVMLGSMLAGTDEAPGSVLASENGMFKEFRGMASKEANEGKDIPIAEGISTVVPYKGSVINVLNDIRGGLGSGCSYSGVENLADLYENSMYIRVTELSHKESMPHAR